MDFNFALFFMALGLAVTLEAMLWLIAPQRMHELVLKLALIPVERLRPGAFVMLALGLLVCAAGRALL
jgi:uncharacterized protein YjeT (DUF2065 family)